MKGFKVSDTLILSLIVLFIVFTPRLSPTWFPENIVPLYINAEMEGVTKLDGTAYFAFSQTEDSAKEIGEFYDEYLDPASEIVTINTDYKNIIIGEGEAWLYVIVSDSGWLYEDRYPIDIVAFKKTDREYTVIEQTLLYSYNLPNAGEGQIFGTNATYTEILNCYVKPDEIAYMYMYHSNGSPEVHLSYDCGYRVSISENEPDSLLDQSFRNIIRVAYGKELCGKFSRE